MTHPDGEPPFLEPRRVARFAIATACSSKMLIASIERMKQDLASFVVADDVEVKVALVAVGPANIRAAQSDMMRMQGEKLTNDLLGLLDNPAACHPVLLFGMTGLHDAGSVLPDPYDGPQHVRFEVPR